MKATKKQEERVARTVVYIGPTIQGVARKNTVYNNGLPKGLVELQETMPILKNLVIGVDKLREARRDLGNPSSALSVVYKKVLQKTGGKENV